MIMKRPESSRPSPLQRVSTGFSGATGFESAKALWRAAESWLSERPAEAIGECAASAEVDKPQD